MPCTLPHSLGSYAGNIPCTLPHTLGSHAGNILRTLPLLSESNTGQACTLSFHLKAMPTGRYAFAHSLQILFGSYAGRFPVHFHLPFRKLSRYLPVRFHPNSIRDLSRQCLYALTSIPFQKLSRYLPVRFHLNSIRELSRQCPYTLTSISFRKL